MFATFDTVAEALKYVGGVEPEGGFEYTGEENYRRCKRPNGDADISYWRSEDKIFLKNHSTRESGKTRSAMVYLNGRPPQDPAAAQQARSGAEKAQREEEQRIALKKATEQFEGWCTKQPELSPYAQKKGIAEALLGTEIRYNAQSYGDGKTDYYGALVAPVHNGFSTMATVGYHCYLPNGGKLPLVSGMGKPYAPVTYVHGQIPAAKEKRKLIICEGLSTAASVAMAVKTRSDAGQICVVTCHGVERLPNVCRAANLASWVSDVFVMGDSLDGNKGVAAKYLEASEIGAIVVWPEGKPSNYDYNDLHREEGLGAVCVAVADALQRVYLQDDTAIPMNALPCLVRHAMLDVRAMTGADMGLILQATLAACSLGVQGIANISAHTVKNDLTSLYFLTIAEFNELKSTVEKLVLLPFALFDEEQARKYENEKRKQESAMRKWKKRKAEIKLQYKEPPKEGEKTTYAQRDVMMQNELELWENEMPKEPTRHRCMVRSGTMQGIGRTLRHNYSIGLMSSEGGQFVGGYGMSRENAMATTASLNTLFSDGTYENTVLKDGEESAVFSKRRATMHLQFQSSVYAKLLQNVDAEDIGFLGRCFIHRVVRESNDSFKITDAMKEAHRNHPALDALCSRLGELYDEHITRLDEYHNYYDNLPPDEDIKNAMRVEPSIYTTYDLSEGANDVFEWFRNLHLDETNSYGEWFPVRGLIAKMPQNAKRLAAIFHVIEHWSKEEENLEISEETMANACQLCLYYVQALIAEKRANEEKNETREMTNAMKVIREMIGHASKKGKNHTTQRDVANRLNMSVGEFAPILAELARCGNIVVSEVKKSRGVSKLITLPK